MSQGMEQKAAKSLAAGAQRFGTFGCTEESSQLNKRDTARELPPSAPCGCSKSFVFRPIFLSIFLSIRTANDLVHIERHTLLGLGF